MVRRCMMKMTMQCRTVVVVAAVEGILRYSQGILLATAVMDTLPDVAVFAVAGILLAVVGLDNCPVVAAAVVGSWWSSGRNRPLWQTAAIS